MTVTRISAAFGLNVLRYQRVASDETQHALEMRGDREHRRFGAGPSHDRETDRQSIDEAHGDGGDWPTRDGGGLGYQRPVGAAASSQDKIVLPRRAVAGSD